MAPSNVKLSELINLTGKILERRDGDNKDLTGIKTEIDEIIGLKDKLFAVQFYPKEGNPIVVVHVYGDGAGKLVIELHQAGSNYWKTDTFAITTAAIANCSDCSVNFLFKPDAIWFYPTEKSTVRYNNSACDAWILKVDGSIATAEWKPYNILTA